MMRRCLGLDIGSEQTKLVELEKKGRSGVAVTSYGKTVTLDSAVKKGKIADIGALTRVLQQLVLKTKKKTERVVIGLNNQDISIRHLTLPQMPDKEIAQSLEYELSDIFKVEPENTKDISYGYEILARNPQDVKVLLIGCNYSLIKPYVEATKQAGLTPYVIDISAFAVPRVKMDGKNRCYVDLGAYQTVVYVEINGEYSVYRILPIGGKLIDEAISSAFEIDLNAARKLKATESVDHLLMEGSGQLSLIRSAFQQYIGGILQTLDYVRAQVRASSILEILDEVVIYGGNALIKGLEQMLTQELEIEVNKLDPFAEISTVDNSQTHDAPIYSNAVGLALRGLEER